MSKQTLQKKKSVEQALRVYGLKGGEAITSVAVDRVFIAPVLIRGLKICVPLPK